MRTRPDPHNVREFVENLAAGTRVIWIANGTKGTVQPNKAILWDDGSSMTAKQMNHAHALLIHSEAEWQQMHKSLRSVMKCLRCGCTLQRWDAQEKKGDHPEQLCPVAVLSDPEAPPRSTRPQHLPGSVRLGVRHRGRLSA
jgi:hypothetical protein